mgnify:CR=1 FL=1
MQISKENYLKAIYSLELKKKTLIKTQNLANYLEISPASVTEMLKKLAAENYLSYIPYKGAKLLKKGLELAKKIIRRHRILELYLHKKLKFQWDEVHIEAENLEHAVSDNLINKMEEILQFPQFDPHGDPIPDINGIVPKQNDIPLSEATKSKHVIISRVSDESPEFLNYLKSKALTINKKIKIKNSFLKKIKLKIQNKIAFFEHMMKTIQRFLAIGMKEIGQKEHMNYYLMYMTHKKYLIQVKY